MRIAIDSMSSHIANLDLDIARTKSVLFSICPSVLRRDITNFNFVRMLNSRLYSFLYASKASKFNSLVGPLPVSVNNHAISAVQTNLVVKIPPKLSYPTLRDQSSQRVSNLFPAPGPLTSFQLRQTPNPFSDVYV